MARRVYQVDKYSWQVVAEYKSLYAAVKATGEPRARIASGCYHGAISKERYVWRFADSFDPNEDISASNFTPCTVQDTETGKTYIVPSASVLASRLGLKAETVSRAILSGKLVKGRLKVRRGIGKLS